MGQTKQQTCFSTAEMCEISKLLITRITSFSSPHANKHLLLTGGLETTVSHLGRGVQSDASVQSRPQRSPDLLSQRHAGGVPDAPALQRKSPALSARCRRGMSLITYLLQ